MTFQIKDFRSIVLAMINHAKATQDKVTDFHVGSVVRTLFEAPAIEIDEFYQQVFRGLRDAIPVSVYKAFGHDLLPPAYASGFVRFSTAVKASKTITVPAGFEIGREDSDVKYVTRDQALIEPMESFVDVRVTAQTIGMEGNADIGQLTIMESSIDGVSTVTNLKPITGGRNQETEDERENRFLKFIAALSRGTIPAIQYAMTLAKITNKDGEVIEYVTRVGIDEVPGYIDVYIYGSGGTPSSELISKAQFIIDGGYDEETGKLVPGYKGGGVSAVVSPMIAQSVDFNLYVKAQSKQYETQDTIDSMETALYTALTSLEAGKTMPIAELRLAVLSVPGILRVVFETDANVECGINQILNVGKLSVTWLP